MFCLHVCVQCVCLVLWRPEESIRSSRSGVIAVCEPPCRLSAKATDVLNCCHLSNSTPPTFYSRAQSMGFSVIKTGLPKLVKKYQ